MYGMEDFYVWNKMEDFDEYGIWKIPIPFHFIACPAH